MATDSRQWRLADSLAQLRKEVNAKYPNRSKKSDGTIGDAAHRSRKSDHNPDEKGRVKAIDLTHDLKPDGTGFSAAWLAERLRLKKDPRISYVIFGGRIFSSTVRPWQWRPYTGSNPHNHHVHISVTAKGADDARPWGIA